MAPDPVTRAPPSATRPTARASQAHRSFPTPALRRTRRRTRPRRHRQRQGQHQDVEIGAHAAGHGVGAVGDVLGQAEARRGPAGVDDLHEFRPPGQGHELADGHHHGGDPPCPVPRRRPGRPTPRAAMSTTRATDVANPSSLVIPATRTRITAAARADGSSPQLEAVGHGPDGGQRPERVGVAVGEERLGHPGGHHHQEDGRRHPDHQRDPAVGPPGTPPSGRTGPRPAPPRPGRRRRARPPSSPRAVPCGSR